MKLNISFKELEMLLSNIGATSVIWLPKPVSPPKPKLIPPPVVTPPTGVIDIEKILKKTPDNTSFQFLVYIKEIKLYRGDFSFPKFHFYKCQTLKRMEIENKYDKKYVSTTRKDRQFLVDMPYGNNQHKEELKELDVCKNCLAWYNERCHTHYTVQTFDIEELFKYFDRTPIDNQPIYMPETARASGYTEDWDKLSLELRQRYKWICQECGKNCSNNHHNLHVHHINSVTNDNSESNLKVLCKYCHAKQPNHQHMGIY